MPAGKTTQWIKGKFQISRYKEWVKVKHNYIIIIM